MKMKNNIIFHFRLTIILVTIIAFCAARPAEDEYADYENADAPPPPKKPVGRPLTSRRNPLAGRPSAKTASSTTSTTEAPKVCKSFYTIMHYL